MENYFEAKKSSFFVQLRNIYGLCGWTSSDTKQDIESLLRGFGNIA